MVLLVPGKWLAVSQRRKSSRILTLHPLNALNRTINRARAPRAGWTGIYCLQCLNRPRYTRKLVLEREHNRKASALNGHTFETDVLVLIRRPIANTTNPYVRRSTRSTVAARISPQPDTDEMCVRPSHRHRNIVGLLSSQHFGLSAEWYGCCQYYECGSQAVGSWSISQRYVDRVCAQVGVFLIRMDR